MLASFPLFLISFAIYNMIAFLTPGTSWEGALFSVLGGLVPCAVVAVPSSVGYGVGAGGRVALDAALATCASGISVVNIDNGFGAAHAALRILHASRPAAEGSQPRL